MRTWDVIVIGGGIVGLSLSIALRKRALKVLLVERGEPGREASHAAAGMLVGSGFESPDALHPLAAASARLYPEFVHELKDESGIDADLREQGTIAFVSQSEADHLKRRAADQISSEELAALEPSIAVSGQLAVRLSERSVDPRALTSACAKAARHRGVDIASGSLVTGVLLTAGRVTGISTVKANYAAPVVVNCAGAWAGQILPHMLPVRPVKGQMLSVVGQAKLRHVIRAPEVYLVPRSDGRILIGATVEEAGYDKRTSAETIQRLHQAAIRLAPMLQQARILEDWAGLRPGTPDNLPILGATEIPGYFVATGHFRDGILLAPVSAQVMAQLITGEPPGCDIAAFSSARFQALAAS